MKIALIGSGGQLAADLAVALTSHEVVGFARPQFDLHDPDSIARGLAGTPWDVVINTAAYNLVDQAERDLADAFATNAIGTANLARHCGKSGIRLLHFSTDFVFGLDADKKTPWTETDHPGPVSIYGISKLAGEHAVRAYADNHLIIRTCGLYGHKGSRGKGGNFVETMLRLADTGKPIRVVGDQRCTPSFTRDIAQATARLLETNALGVIHLTSEGDCTWFEFASTIFELAQRKVDCQPITSSQFNAPAKRPPYSVLSLKRLSALVGAPPHWRDALARYLAERSSP